MNLSEMDLPKNSLKKKNPSKSNEKWWFICNGEDFISL